jgi:hypothetical protein
MSSSPVYFCPLCSMWLLPSQVRVVRFDCPNCQKSLRAVYFPGYLWIRGIVTYVGAFVLAWQLGWHDSFIVFVFSFYVFPMLIIWECFIHPFVPVQRIEPAPRSMFFTTLDLSNR